MVGTYLDLENSTCTYFTICLYLGATLGTMAGIGIYSAVRKPPHVSGMMAYGFFKTIAPAAASNGIYSTCMLAFTLRRQRLERQAAQQGLETGGDRIAMAGRVVSIEDSLPTYQEVTKEEILVKISKGEEGGKNEMPPTFEAATHL